VLLVLCLFGDNQRARDRVLPACTLCVYFCGPYETLICNCTGEIVALRSKTLQAITEWLWKR
jgi:hypothetical protein